MPAKDRPPRDINSDTEWPALKEAPQSRLVSIPIGSDPDLDDEEDGDDPFAGEDQVVERWLNGAVRARH